MDALLLTHHSAAALLSFSSLPARPSPGAALRTERNGVFLRSFHALAPQTCSGLFFAWLFLVVFRLS